MTKEEKFILYNRLVTFIILLLCIFVPIIISSIANKDIEVVHDNIYEPDSDSYTYTMEITFNKKVEGCYVEVDFYNGDKFVTKEHVEFYLTDDHKTFTKNVYLYSWEEVNSYEIISCDYYEYKYRDTLNVILILVSSIYLLLAICLRCNKYEYNDKCIIVYAGFKNHYIKVNGEMYDEHVTLVSHTPIKLSCTLDSGEVFTATISLMNTISAKLNNKYIAPIKKIRLKYE